VERSPTSGTCVAAERSPRRPTRLSPLNSERLIDSVSDPVVPPLGRDQCRNPQLAEPCREALVRPAAFAHQAVPLAAVQSRPQHVAALVLADRQLACGSCCPRTLAAASSRRSSNSATIAAAAGWLVTAPCSISSSSGVMRLNTAVRDDCLRLKPPGQIRLGDHRTLNRGSPSGLARIR